MRNNNCNYAKEFDNAACKLSDAQVQEIRDLYCKGGWTHRSLAEEFGVHYSHIGRILRKEKRIVNDFNENGHK